MPVETILSPDYLALQARLISGSPVQTTSLLSPPRGAMLRTMFGRRIRFIWLGRAIQAYYGFPQIT